MSHTITADFSGGANTAIDKPAWQYDYGTDLVIKGLDLPTAVEVHFATAEYGGTAETRVGTTADGITTVAIPDRLLEMPGRQDYRIYAYIYLTDVDSGHTEYKICIRVRARPKPGEEHPDEDKDHPFSDVLQAVNKLDKEKLNTPVSPVAGQLLRVKTINDDGTIVLETVAGSGGGGSGLPEGGTAGQVLVKKTDADGDCAWVDPQTATVRTSMDDVALAGAKYFLGEQTALSITMPNDAQTGQEIMVVFSSGQTACTLAVDLDDFDFVPRANSMCKIVFLCVDADTWLVDTKEG